MVPTRNKRRKDKLEIERGGETKVGRYKDSEIGGRRKKGGSDRSEVIGDRRSLSSCRGEEDIRI